MKLIELALEHNLDQELLREIVEDDLHISLASGMETALSNEDIRRILACDGLETVDGEEFSPIITEQYLERHKRSLAAKKAAETRRRKEEESKERANRLDSESSPDGNNTIFIHSLASHLEASPESLAIAASHEIKAFYNAQCKVSLTESAKIMQSGLLRSVHSNRPIKPSDPEECKKIFHSISINESGPTNSGKMFYIRYIMGVVVAKIEMENELHFTELPYKEMLDIAYQHQKNSNDKLGAIAEFCDRLNPAKNAVFPPDAISAVSSGSFLPRKNIPAKSLLQLTKSIYGRVNDTEASLRFSLDQTRLFTSMLLGSLGGRAISLVVGPPGTGKSTALASFGKALGAKVHTICVRSNWREPERMLGYLNPVSPKHYIPSVFFDVLAAAYESLEDARRHGTWPKIHVAILEEMGIAPADTYLGDILQALDPSRKIDGPQEKGPYLYSPYIVDGPDTMPAGTIPLPPNLIICGTTNNDLGSWPIPPKVASRSFVFFMSHHNQDTEKDIPITGKEFANEIPMELIWNASISERNNEENIKREDVFYKDLNDRRVKEKALVAFALLKRLGASDKESLSMSMCLTMSAFALQGEKHKKDAFNVLKDNHHLLEQTYIPNGLCDYLSINLSNS